jgi:hypothetical protein
MVMRPCPGSITTRRSFRPSARVSERSPELFRRAGLGALSLSSTTAVRAAAVSGGGGSRMSDPGTGYFTGPSLLLRKTVVQEF